MFLTNQPFKRPWEDKGDKLQIKDWNFYKSQQNIWTNPHRSSKKVAQFFHQGDQLFNEIHYSDEELLRMQMLEEQNAREHYHKDQIQQTQERLANRKLEREILQYKAKQQVFTNDDQNLEQFASYDPFMTQELTMKRSMSYKDPTKTSNIQGATWNQIDHCPTKQLDKLIRPVIVEMDAKGCERIIKKINDDRNIKDAMKEYYNRNRQQIREKFLQRTQQLEHLQHKSGQKLVKQDTQNNFSIGLSQLQLFKNSQQRLMQPQNDNLFKTASSFLGQYQNINGDRIAMLSQPKQDYETNNIFNHQDFRGLLHADHEEALKNSTATLKMKKSQSQRFMTAPGKSQASSYQTEMKQSTITKELFPIPEIKTPSNYMLQTLRGQPNQTGQAKSTMRSDSSLSSFIRYGYDSHKPKKPFAQTINPIFSKHGKKLTHLKSEAEIKRFHLESDLDQFLPNEKFVVEEEMQQLNEVDRITNQSKKKRRNRYPRTALDQALNYHKSFQEHLASKKQQQMNQEGQNNL
eukprot:403373138